MNTNHHKKEIKQPAGANGLITVKAYRPGTLRIIEPLAREAMALMRRIASEADERTRRLLQAEEDTIRAHIEQIKAAGILGIRAQNHNLIVTSDDRGINQIIKQWAGTSGNSMTITHGEIGTSATAPALSDTALTAATNRKAVTLAEITAPNQITLQFFWADAELTNGTYREFGVYANGTNLTLGNGRLVNHALFSPVYTKASNEDTTVEVQLTINNA